MACLFQFRAGSGFEGLEQATAEHRLEMHDASPLADAVPETAAPPAVDLFGENAKRLARLDLDQHADRRLIAAGGGGAHRRCALLRFSACCLKASSWSPQNASTSSSQSRSRLNGSRSSRYTRTRASCSGSLSLTRPVLRKKRKWRLMAGLLVDNRSASSLALRGSLRKSSITPRRVGSAS